MDVRMSVAHQGGIDVKLVEAVGGKVQIDVEGVHWVSERE